MRRLTSLLVAVGLVATACSSSTSTSADTSPGEVQPSSPPEAAAPTLRWALGADPTSLDPARVVTDADELVVDALFDSLTRLAPDGTVLPALASTWEADAEATTFTFTLDPDARWHDGSRVVAADVVRGLRRVADQTVARPSLHGSLLDPIVGITAARGGGGLPGVEAIDDSTVQVRTTAPTPQLPVVLSHPALAPAPQAAVDDPEAFGESPSGNGPFRLAEPWAHNQFLRLEPADVHPATPAVGEVLFRVYADDSDGELRWADLVTGQVQVSEVSIPRRDEVGAAEGDGTTLRMVDDVGPVTSVLLADADGPLTRDTRFRRAVSLLVDRDDIAQRTNGARVPADALVPPPLVGAPSTTCRFCRTDAEEAASLIAAVLADRTSDDTLPDEPLVIVTANDGASTAVTEQVRAGLRRSGVPVRVESVPPAEVPATIAGSDPALVALQWSATAPLAESFLTELVGPASVGRAITGWESPALQDHLRKLSSAADPALRRLRVQQLERLVLEGAVVVPIHFDTGDLAVAPGVTGVVRDPHGTVDLTAVDVGGAS